MALHYSVSAWSRPLPLIFTSSIPQSSSLVHIFSRPQYCRVQAITSLVGPEGREATAYSHALQQSTWHKNENELAYLLSMQKSVPCGVVLTRGSWAWQAKEMDHYQLRGIMKFCNVTRRNEIFVTEVQSKIVLLSNGSLDQITTFVQVHSKHPGDNPKSRLDGYWPAYIIKAQDSTQIEVVIDMHSINRESLSELQALNLEIGYVAYGPYGLSDEVQHVILPLQSPKMQQNEKWQQLKNGAVLSIRTHILCHMDDPLQVLQRYVLPHARYGDVIAIGETPLAVMQGRFRHPRSIRPSAFAKFLCRFFQPSASLATACGMQALIDISGKLRVIIAFLIAALARVLRRRGVFYMLAGEQARLIDDVTGTLPPYDQFIALGPVQAQRVAELLQEQTGYGIAIVDVNNLRRVHILAASDKVNRPFLETALVKNPAGNDDEQTPIVIVRQA